MAAPQTGNSAIEASSSGGAAPAATVTQPTLRLAPFPEPFQCFLETNPVTFRQRGGNEVEAAFPDLAVGVNAHVDPSSFSVRLNLQVKFGEPSCFLVAEPQTELAAARGRGNEIARPSEARTNQISVSSLDINLRR